MFFKAFTLFSYFTQPTWFDNLGQVGPTKFQEHWTAVSASVLKALSGAALTLKLDSLPTAGDFYFTVYTVESYSDWTGEAEAFSSFSKQFPSEQAAVNWLKRASAAGSVPEDWSHCVAPTFAGKFPPCPYKFRYFLAGRSHPVPVFFKTDTLVLASLS